MERAKGTERLLEIVEHLGRAEAPVSRNALASAMGIPRSTVYALVEQLLARGWLSQSANGEIALGQKIGLLGLAYSRQASFEPLAAEALRALANETGQSMELNIVDNWQQLVVVAAQGFEHTYLNPAAGLRVPLPATVSARVLLEGVPSARIRANIPPAHFRLADGRFLAPESFFAEIAESGRVGHAAASGLLESHVGVIAVPVRDASDRCIAAISMIMLAQSMEARLSEMLARLHRTAEKLQDTLTLGTWPLGERCRQALHGD
jgi:DNA-binding IclR family transcriptional regulator